MRKPLIAGIIGPKGAGKETLIKNCVELLIPYNVQSLHLQTKSPITEALNAFGIEQSRENQQWLAIAMKEKFGDKVIPNALKERVKHTNADVVFYDCIRWQSDFDFVVSRKPHLLVGIDAKQRVRWRRCRERARQSATVKQDEKNITLRSFAENEAKANTETMISGFMKKADFVIENNDNLSELYTKIQRLVAFQIIPLLMGRR